MYYIKHLSLIWDHLGYYCLGIPASHMSTIRNSTSSDEESLEAVIKEWLSGKGHPPSWKRLISELFTVDVNIANTIKFFAEPIQGLSIASNFS